MKPKNSGWIIVLVQIILLAGCSGLDRYLGQQKPTLHFQKVGLQNISFDSLTLLFDVEVENPYGVALPLLNADYALAGFDKQFLSGKADLQGTIPARGRKTVQIPARVGYVETLNALKEIKPGSVFSYVADLGLSFDAPGLGALRVPMKREGQLPIPAIPEISISEIKWDQLTLEKAGGHVKLNLVNRNQFPVELQNLDYDLNLGGVKVADSDIARGLSLSENGGTGTIEIPLSISPAKLGAGVFNMLTGKGSGYELKGAVDLQSPFGPMNLPVEKMGQAVFMR